jgi:hypothetical protein
MYSASESERDSAVDVHNAGALQEIADLSVHFGKFTKLSRKSAGKLTHVVVFEFALPSLLHDSLPCAGVCVSLGL